MACIVRIAGVHAGNFASRRQRKCRARQTNVVGCEFVNVATQTVKMKVVKWDKKRAGMSRSAMREPVAFKCIGKDKFRRTIMHWRSSLCLLEIIVLCQLCQAPCFCRDPWISSVNLQKSRNGESALLVAQSKKLIEGGEADKALRLLRLAESKAPSTPGLYATLGEALAEEKEYRLSVKAFCKAIEQTPRDGKLYHLRSMAYVGTKQFDEAVKDLTTYMNFGGKQFFGHFWRGGTYEQMGEFEKALADYDSAIAIDRTRAARIGVHNQRAAILARMGRVQQATAAYSELIGMNPIDEDLLLRRGELYFKQGRYKLAVDDLSEAIKLNDEAERLFLSRARAYEKLGQYDLAGKDRKRAHDLSKKAVQIPI